MGRMRWKTLGILGLLITFVAVQWPSSNLKVVFCDVGQGDTELIIKGSVQVLIDGGPSGAGVMKCLGDHLPFWDRKLEMVVNTHADKDHIGGLDEVAASYEIGLLVVSEPGTNQDFGRLVQEITANKIKVHLAAAGERLRIGGLEFEILWPRKLDKRLSLGWEGKSDTAVLGVSTERNENSVVMRLRYGEFTAMFTGDIGEKTELALIEAGVITPVTILKVPHHGSKYSSSEKFLEQLRPKLAVIEVGEKNSYGHPSSIIIERFDTLGTRLLRTDRDGETVVMSDGERWWLW